MRLYSIYDCFNWVDDMTADQIMQLTGCSKAAFRKASVDGRLINNRYAIVHDGNFTITKSVKKDRELLREFDAVTNRLKRLVSA